MLPITRRTALLAPVALPALAAGAESGHRLNHSAVWWCFHNHGAKWDITTFCRQATALGLKSIELVEPTHWPVMKQHKLEVAISGNGYPKTGFVYGLNNPKHSREVVAATAKRMELCNEAGVKRVIAFVGMRYVNPTDPKSGEIGRDDARRETVARLKDLAAVAERLKVTVCVEHLNSRDATTATTGHPGYQGDDLDFVVEMLRAVGSEYVKLLFDIYHVQIMHGDLTRRLAGCRDVLGHLHTAGVPGRGELDGMQEIHYPAVAAQLVRMNYAGYVGHEFIPTRDPAEGLREAIRACE